MPALCRRAVGEAGGFNAVQKLFTDRRPGSCPTIQSLSHLLLRPSPVFVSQRALIEAVTAYTPLGHELVHQSREPLSVVALEQRLVGSGAGAVTLVRSVSSPRPSNRACGSPAHGSPTPFTGGVRPEPARPGWAWVRRRFH